MMTESSAVAGLLVGKRSLIFGAGRGIGRATTLALAAAGSAVGVVDVDAERAAVVAGEARALGVLAKPYQADVRSTEDVDRVVRVAASCLGGLDGVVTVVGGMAEFAAFKNVHEYTDPEWDLIVDVNLRYVFRVARAAIAVMIEQGSGGSIVSVGSISGMAGGPHHSPYGSAKAGLVNLARSVAAEYGHLSIRMNVVAPGSIDAPAVASARTSSEYDELTAKIPLGRRGTPEDVADVIAFFVSDLSRYVTGQTLLVDGGVTVRYPHRVQNARASEAG
jgi:3-oxoacyl-[acyl-carrier protein] reductase